MKDGGEAVRGWKADAWVLRAKGNVIWVEGQGGEGVRVQEVEVLLVHVEGEWEGCHAGRLL